ncbi:MAG TPA: penicillin-binding transpeptidase domain-containing protein, partial [Gammaproteobacteria bacterium]
KPFTISAALESGRFRPTTPIDTSPGLLKVGGFTIRDSHDYGRIDVSTVIQKSSNVGASRIALALEPRVHGDMLARFGFGYDTGSGFPGESAGLLNAYQEWGEAQRATISYGYGMSVTPLQLARAYAILAGDGVQRPLSFLKLDPENQPRGREVIAPRVARQVREMLERAVQSGGTGTRAGVAGYRVAGKTGTVRKAVSGGYTEDHYLSVFAGMAPASRPRLAMVVVVDHPDDGEYYGGVIAAPVFSRVMEGALRLLDVAPDNLETLKGVTVAMAGGME